MFWESQSILLGHCDTSATSVRGTRKFFGHMGLRKMIGQKTGVSKVRKNVVEFFF